MSQLFAEVDPELKVINRHSYPRRHKEQATRLDEKAATEAYRYERYASTNEDWHKAAVTCPVCQQPRILRGREHIEGEDPPLPCFRCGVCCTGYKVNLSLVEARRICDGLGLNWYIFLGNYIEPCWTGADSFFLRQQDGACIFLKHTNEPHRTICLIQAWKPAACREWTPSLYRRECQQGLTKYWGLTVDASGELQGPDERIEHFRHFLGDST